MPLPARLRGRGVRATAADVPQGLLGGRPLHHQHRERRQCRQLCLRHWVCWRRLQRPLPRRMQWARTVHAARRWASLTQRWWRHHHARIVIASRRPGLPLRRGLRGHLLQRDSPMPVGRRRGRLLRPRRMQPPWDVHVSRRLLRRRLFARWARPHRAHLGLSWPLLGPWPVLARGTVRVRCGLRGARVCASHCAVTRASAVKLRAERLLTVRRVVLQLYSCTRP